MSYFWDKIPNTRNFKEEKSILSHGFSGFSSQSSGLKAKTAWWKSLGEGSCSTYCNQKREETVAGMRVYSASFNQTSPPNNLFSYQFINGLIK